MVKLPKPSVPSCPVTFKANVTVPAAASFEIVTSETCDAAMVPVMGTKTTSPESPVAVSLLVWIVGVMTGVGEVAEAVCVGVGVASVEDGEGTFVVDGLGVMVIDGVGEGVTVVRV